MKNYYKTSNTVTINHKHTNHKKTYPVYETSKGGYFYFFKNENNEKQKRYLKKGGAGEIEEWWKKPEFNVPDDFSTSYNRIDEYGLTSKDWDILKSEYAIELAPPALQQDIIKKYKKDKTNSNNKPKVRARPSWMSKTSDLTNTTSPSKPDRKKRARPTWMKEPSQSSYVSGVSDNIPDRKRNICARINMTQDINKINNIEALLSNMNL